MSNRPWLVLGTDSSGRPIRATRRFADVLQQVYDALGWTPVTTQGGWMGELAAEKSSTTHDGDAADFRVRNLTVGQRLDLVRVLRAHGIAAWVRDEEHGGFDDPHIHAVPGAWASPSASALRQWEDCLYGRDGLASHGDDYHPYPLSTEPPEEPDMTPADRERLTNIEKAVTRLLTLAEGTATKDVARDSTSKARHAQLRAEIAALPAEVAKEVSK